MRVHKRRFRGGFAGFGEDEVTTDDQGRIVYVNKEGQSGTTQLVASPLAQRLGVTGTAPLTSTRELSTATPAVKQQVENAHINFMPAEQIPPSDPRHPDHALWLADQAILQKRAKMKAAAPYILAGGGGLAAVLVAVVLLRKRRAAA